MLVFRYISCRKNMLIKKDKDIIQGYLEDYSNIPGGNAIGVVIPENEGEVIDFLKKFYQEKIPVTVSGGGTGTTGGRVPYGGYVLSTERLNKIKEIGKDYVITEPGVVYQDLDRELNKKGLLFPPNPTETTSFIGGNVATNASGSRSFTRNYVNRLRIVLSNGDILDLRRGAVRADARGVFNIEKIILQRPMYEMPSTKNAAGYYTKPGMDLLDLFIGSEGTLGVITEIELKVVPKFKNLCAFFVFLKEEDRAFSLVRSVEDAIAIEYFDSNSLQFLRKEYTQLPEGAQAGVYIEQDIAGDEDNALGKWMELFKLYEIPDSWIWFGQTKKDLEFYHDLRHALPEKINELVKKHKHIKLNSDIAVPEEKLTEMVDFYKKKFIPSGIRYFIFGHIGDAHLHTNLLPNTPEQVELAQQIYLEIMKKAVSLGGTISAEHGVGKIKHKYLEIMYGRKGIKEMARIKKALDPVCILNIGNIFPKKDW